MSLLSASDFTSKHWSSKEHPAYTQHGKCTDTCICTEIAATSLSLQRPGRAAVFMSLVYFSVSLYDIRRPYTIHFIRNTRYSLLVLKVPLNTNQPTYCNSVLSALPKLLCVHCSTHRTRQLVICSASVHYTQSYTGKYTTSSISWCMSFIWPCHGTAARKP